VVESDHTKGDGTGNGVRPYASSALIYQHAGWSGVLPLPPGKKEPPLKGYTGWNGKDPSQQMIDMWCGETCGDYQGHSNIAIHLPDGVLGIDVDHYGDKRGGDTLGKLEAELGPLPPTWRSSAHGGISGIRWFRVEPGMRWPTGPGKDIDFIHVGHRYAVVWPSVHPETGTQYQWTGPDGQLSDDVPTDDDLAWLPDEWQIRFTAGIAREDHPEVEEATEEQRSQCLTEGDMCQATRKALAKYDDRKVAAARHDSMGPTVMALVRLGEQGHHGVKDAIKALYDQFTAEVAPDRMDGSEKSEFARSLNGAIAKVTAAPTADEDKRCCGPDPQDQVHEVPEDELRGDQQDQPSLILPAEFYESRPVLKAIRDYAHSRGAAADTVLYATLARVSAMVPHECRLATGIGPPLGASLNLFVAAVGPPGSGKSSGASVAKDLYTSALLDLADGLPLGSGEGVAEAFMGWEEQETVQVYKTGDQKGQSKKIKAHCQVRHNAFFVADEGEALTKMIERAGATIGAALRSAWYGQTLGQQNADAERRRRVPEGSYAMGMLIGFQPETVLPLLRDGAAGTPQRFVYCHTIDPTKPATRPTLGGVPTQHLQARAGNMIIPEAIADEVWQHHHAYTTGAIMVDRLDAHGHLTRLKLGALLALLEGRRVVSEDDWTLTKIMWDTSCAVRDHYLAHAKISEAHERHTRNLNYADREEMAETRRQKVRDASTKIVRVARLVAKYVHDPAKPSKTVGDVNRRLKSEARPHLTEALEYAASEGWIEIDGNDLAPGPSRPAESSN
jgi:hypothetical protein